MTAGTMPVSASDDPRQVLKLCAKYCATLGWRLVPMKIILGGTKEPYFELLPVPKGSRKCQWSPLRHAPTTSEQIESWFRYDPDVNIAVITGPESGIVVVDVDHLEARPKPFQITPSPQAITSRGFHSYYRYADKIKRITRHAWGEILCGGLVMLPPSLHPSGERYSWSLDLAPWEVPIDDLPPAIARLAQEGTCAPRSARHSAGDPNPTSTLANAFSDEGTVSKVCDVLGIRYSHNGGSVRCVICPDNCPSASVWRADNAAFIYHHFHADGTPHAVMMLQEVYASKLAGRIVRFRDNPWVLGTWGTRLLCDAGVWKLAEVPGLELPKEAPHCAVTAARGFRKLLGCRWRVNHGLPVAYTRQFASAWCSIGEPAAEEGITWLVRGGYLRVAGRTGRTRLFLPSSIIAGEGTR